MDDLVWITAIVAILIFNLYKLRHGKDPKDELLKAKQLLDEGLIDSSLRGTRLRRLGKVRKAYPSCVLTQIVDGDVATLFN